MIRDVIGGEPDDYVPLGQHIVCAVNVCGGRPTFKYTRIEVAGALDRLAAGETMESIIAGFKSAFWQSARFRNISIK